LQTALLSAGVNAFFGIVTGILIRQTYAGAVPIDAQMKPHLIAELRQKLKEIMNAKMAEAGS
jgi:hypothetical protein